MKKNISKKTAKSIHSKNALSSKKSDVRHQHKKTVQRNASRSKTKKNISLSKVIHKVVSSVVTPIKQIVQHKSDEVDVPFAESRSASELTTSMKFFYSNDRFIETFDDKDIYAKICRRWPALHEECKTLQHKRSAILEMLADEAFMKELNEQFEMNAFDVISFLFRLCPSLFKGIFVKKVQNVVNRTQYAKKLKKHKYKIAKAAKAVSKNRKCSF